MPNTVQIILQGFDRTAPAFKSATKNLADLQKLSTGTFALMGAAAAAAAAGGLTTMVAKSIENADAMGKMAQKAGLAVEDFSQLSFAAKLADVSQESLIKGTKTLSEEMVKAGRGSEDLLQQLLAQADAFKNMPDGIEKVNRATKLFGKSGQDLIPLLNQGAEAIRAQMREADGLGQTISTQFAKDANEFDDNLSKIKASLTGMGNALTKSVLPELKNFSEWVLESQAIPIFFDTIKNSINDMTAGLKALIEAAKTLPQHQAAANSGRPQWLQPGMKPGQFDKDIDEFLKQQKFIGPPAPEGPTARSSDLVNFPPAPMGPNRAGGGAGALNPGDDSQLAAIRRFDELHSQSLIKAMELQGQFEEMKLSGSDAERARIDNDYQHWLTNIGQMRLDEDESIALSNQAWEVHHQRLQTLQSETFAQYASVAGRGFGLIATLAGAFGKKNFVLTQVMRSGEAVMNTATGVTRALAAADPPYNFILAGMVAAEGAAQIAMIAAQKPPQAHGGADYIPETATYLLSRGERVLAPNQNRELMQAINGDRNINVYIGDQLLGTAVWNGSRNGTLTVHPRAVRESV